MSLIRPPSQNHRIRVFAWVILKISKPAPPDTSYTAFSFAEVDYPRVPQPRLVVRFADGLLLLLCDSSDLDLAAQLIARIRPKTLYYDRIGLWIASKRLEKGTFSWPPSTTGDGKIRLHP